MACAPSEDPDQPGHPPNLIRVVTIRMKKPRVLSYARRRLWSDWADAQADLSLLWAHSHFVGFVMRRLRSSFLHACVPLTKLRDIWTLILLCWSKRQIFGFVLRDQDLWTEEKEYHFCGKRSLKSKPELRFHANGSDKCVLKHNFKKCVWFLSL